MRSTSVNVGGMFLLGFAFGIFDGSLTYAEPVQFATTTINSPGQYYCARSKDPVRKIVLVGEVHNTADAIAAVNILSERAATEGSIYLGLEAPAYDKGFQNRNAIRPFLDGKLLREGSTGIEEHFVYGLTAAVAVYKQLYNKYYFNIGKNVDPDHLKSWVLADLAANRYTKETWGLVSSVAKSESPATEVWERAARLKKDDPTTALIVLPTLEQMKEFENTESFIFLLKNLIFKYVYLANTKYRIKMGTPQLSSISFLMEEPKDDDRYELFIDEVALAWRNLFMARNIGDLYCKAEKAGRDLYVMIGDLHAKGLKGLLLRMNKNSRRAVPIERTTASTLAAQERKRSGFEKKLGIFSKPALPTRFDNNKPKLFNDDPGEGEKYRQWIEEVASRPLVGQIRTILQETIKILEKNYPNDFDQSLVKVVQVPAKYSYQLELQYPLDNSFIKEEWRNVGAVVDLPELVLASEKIEALDLSLPVLETLSVESPPVLARHQLSKIIPLLRIIITTVK